MRVSSVKPVLWWSINLHYLFSNGVVFNTQSRSSRTSYEISRSKSQAIHRWGDGDLLIIAEMALLTISWNILCSPNVYCDYCVYYCYIFTIYCSLHVSSPLYSICVCVYVLHIYSIFVIHTVMLLSLHMILSPPCIHGIVTIKQFYFNLVASFVHEL